MNSIPHCFLLIFVFYSCPPFASTQYIINAFLPSITLDKRVERLSRAVYHFMTDIYRELLDSNPDGNVFFSPTSLYLGLAMLYAGSNGKTKTELANVLHLDIFESKESEFYENIKILVKTISSSEISDALKMANRLFAHRGISLQYKDEYLRITGEYFNSKMEALDFISDLAGSRSEINKFVSEMTSGKIKELFPRGAIESDTVLALANAVYFNGSWLYKFDKKLTKPQAFSVGPLINETIKVPMMHLLQSRGLRYAVNRDEFKLLELPYSDEDLSMIIAMDERPDDMSHITDFMPNFNMLLTSEMADSSWNEMVDVYTNAPIRLSLPKFFVEQTLNLKCPLRELGVENVFERNANLSGIADRYRISDVYLSRATHRAYLDVGEEGKQEAVGLGDQKKQKPSSKKKIIDFVVDRPFMFLVVEKKTGCILLFGHIQNPLKSN